VYYLSTKLPILVVRKPSDPIQEESFFGCDRSHVYIASLTLSSPANFRVRKSSFIWELWEKFKNQPPDCFNGSYRRMRMRVIVEQKNLLDSKHLGLLRIAGCRCFNAVMPMEIFVSCVGDLATVGGSVVVLTPVRSPPGSFSLSLSLSFFARPWGLESFYPGSFLALWPS
jgi:hypothetical protein